MAEALISVLVENIVSMASQRCHWSRVSRSTFWESKAIQVVLKEAERCLGETLAGQVHLFTGLRSLVNRLLCYNEAKEFEIINCGSVKCVVVVVSGHPVVIKPYLSKINALVAAWFPGTKGQGVSDVLFGDYGFSGKLARTWFKSVDQLPMNVGDNHYDPLLAFGFGLTTSAAKK